MNSIAESVEDMKSADSKTESEKEVASRKEGEELATKMEKKGFL